MYATKILKKTGSRLMAYQTTWLVPETIECEELVVQPRAVLKAPEGKFLTLTVNGVGQEIEQGRTYKGEVVLSVTDAFHMRPGGLMRFNEISRDFHAAVAVNDGKIFSKVPAILQGGTVDDTKTEGVYMASLEKSFNGIVVDGSSEYLVKNVTAEFDGFSDNDFLGVGCAVTAVGNSRVRVEDCEFTINGVTRCLVHAGGNSEVYVKNTKMTNLCPPDAWPGNFSWQVGFCGSTRLAQLSDSASVTYDNCDLHGNGWGVLSIDGTDGGQKLTVKNSRIKLSGPRAHGYGAFCIGENEVVYDNCDVDVFGYPLLLMGMEGLGRSQILNSRIRGRRFGVMFAGDDNSVLTIKNSSFKTGKSVFCLKASSSIINAENSVMESENGTVVQLMDPDECGMNQLNFFIPVGETDTPVEGRNLASVSPTEDVTFNMTGCDIRGNFFNSTTNIRAYRRSEMAGRGQFHDTLIGLVDMMEDEETMDSYGNAAAARHGGDDLRGPKNLGLNFSGTKVTGIISSATQAYREGLKVITEDIRMEMSNVTQSAAPTVNNGVAVSLTDGSVWTVTGTGYITSLTIDESSTVTGADGKKVIMTVDGVPTQIEAGNYTGRIVLTTA